MEILHKTLKEYFGYDTFRNGQEEIIRSIMGGKDTLVVMPTGGGKSICYQLPSLITEGVAIVISPLIALMKDQVDSLNKLGIPATLINSSINQGEIRRRIQDSVQGKYKLMYIAPERLESKRFMKQIRQLKISFLAVDEAHCISEWGHDFRPAYLNISSKLQEIGDFPVIALTATATPEVRKDITKQLKMNDPAEFVRGFDRPNLKYITEKTKNKGEYIAKLIKKTNEGSTIIYCGSRKKVERISVELKSFNVPNEIYHAGMQPIVRKTVQERFLKGETKVIIATNAFGMGINKPDVRNVIHVDYTQTLEAYYQEAGRAGRDDKPSNCVLLFQPGDIFLQHYFIDVTNPDESDLLAFYNYLYDKANYDNKLGEYGKEPLNSEIIANDVGMPRPEAINIVKMFNSKGILSIEKASDLGILKFYASEDRIKQYYNNTTEERKAILQAVLKSIGKEDIYKPKRFDLKLIRKFINISNDHITNLFKAFEYDQIMSFQPDSSSPAFRLLKSKMSISDFQKEFEDIKKKRSHSIEKFNKVVEYSETPLCKRFFILDYFKEDNIKPKCGNCSSCLSGTANKDQKLSEKEKFLLRNILQAVQATENEFSRNSIKDLLKGNVTKQILFFKLQNSEHFGACDNINEKKIGSAIQDAIKYRYVMVSQTKYKPLKLTDQGIKKLEELGYSGNGSSKVKTRKTKKAASSKNLFDISEIIELRLAKYKGKHIKVNAEYESIPETIHDLIEEDPQNEKIYKKFGDKILSDINIKRFKGKINPLSLTIRDNLDFGMNIKELANKVNLNETSIADHIIDLLNKNIDINSEKLFSDNKYNMVLKLLNSNRNMRLVEVKKNLEINISYNILRIIIELIKYEFRIKKL